MDKQENPDYFCVKCLVEGDEKAFVALYKKYHRIIYYSALKMTQSEASAEDITQNVFLKIWDMRAMLDPEQNFVAYIHTICRNAIFDTFKKAAYEETFKTKVRQFIEISETMQEDDDFYEAYKKVLAEAIAKLPPRRQAVFELCKLQGKTYEEVAQRFGISCSTVHDHIVKANQFIREYLLAYSLT